MLKDWKERDFPLIIEREDDPLKLADWNVVKAIPIVGFRRTGKTFLLLNVAKSERKTLSISILRTNGFREEKRFLQSFQEL